MVCNTLAMLVTDTLQPLGFPDKTVLEVEDTCRAVVHSLALLEQHSTYSPLNLALNHIDFIPQTRDFALDNAVGIVVPAWVERQWVNSPTPFDYWHYVPVCNLADLESSRLRGQDRCSFYVEDGQMRIKLSYQPLENLLWTYRLWYTVSPFGVEALNDTALDAQLTSIPQNFFPLVSGMAELEVIPTMMIRAAQLPEPNKALMEAWQARQVYLTAKVAEWSERFKMWAYGNRGARRGRRRRTILRAGARM